MNISIVSIIARMLSSATPIALAGVGGIFGERSGITNIGLEGTMLLGAFSAAVGSFLSGNAWIGLLTGVIVATMVSLFHAFLCITVGVDHTVSGLAINIFAMNFTIYALSAIFGNKGSTPEVPKLPSFNIPLLSNIPMTREIFSNISYLTLAAVVITLVAHYILNKTDFGLHVLASGENSKAAYVLGINVKRVRYVSVLIGGLCCGLAGSFLSISYLGMFVKNMTSGRGFIAIATILFGRYNPYGVAFACLFFGLLDALQISLQGIINIPSEVVQSFPYVMTILFVAINEWRSQRIKRSGIKLME